MAGSGTAMAQCLMVYGDRKVRAGGEAGSSASSGASIKLLKRVEPKARGPAR